jgi:hypothetical protein
LLSPVTPKSLSYDSAGMTEHAGMLGPVLIKWCERLLADRDERAANERSRRPLWPVGKKARVKREREERGVEAAIQLARKLAKA